MNDADRWAKRALTHVHALSQEIGPRGATSDGERRAAAYVRDELQQLGLRDARLEPLRGAVSAWLPFATAFSVATWGMLVGLLFGRVGGIIAALLYLVAAWLLYRELEPSASGRSTRRWLWQGDGQNVLGVAPPAGRVERRVVLLAYLDSARAPFFWRTRERRRLAGRVALLLFLSLPLSALTFLLAALTEAILLYLFALILLFPQAATLVASLYAEHSPFSPGANHNASGVGTLLALAERLAATPLARTEVWILATGCRETGGDGVCAFLEAHGPTLVGATFVALEGVGVGERVVYLTGEGVLRRVPYPSQALALAARAAERCRRDGLEISAERHRGGLTEMGLIVRRGFRGLTVNVWPADRAGVTGRRAVDDTWASIEKGALARAHTFTWRLLQEIDADSESSPS
jgi:hypothetical protein